MEEGIEIRGDFSWNRKRSKIFTVVLPQLLSSSFLPLPPSSQFDISRIDTSSERSPHPGHAKVIVTIITIIIIVAISRYKHRHGCTARPSPLLINVTLTRQVDKFIDRRHGGAKV